MCTGIRFVNAAGKMYFGRNLDWTHGYGEQVIVTPPNADIPSAFARPDGLKGGHAVIGMGIIVDGVPLYFDCGNDAGLAVAGLNFPQSARYAEQPKEGSNNIAAYEFPFWVARNFSTVEEVSQALAETTIVAQPLNDRLPVADLHWLIGDATGSIAVECMDDGLHVWKNDADVLANEPDFGWHRTNLRNYLALSRDEPEPSLWGSIALTPFGSGMGAPGIPGDYSSPARFVKAAFVNSHHPIKEDEAANVARLYRTLGSVAVPEGCVKMADGSYEKTLYTSCFSPSTMTYYHAAYDDLKIGAYPLSSADLTADMPFAISPVA